MSSTVYFLIFVLTIVLITHLTIIYAYSDTMNKEQFRPLTKIETLTHVVLLTSMIASVMLFSVGVIDEILSFLYSITITIILALYWVKKPWYFLKLLKLKPEKAEVIKVPNEKQLELTDERINKAIHKGFIKKDEGEKLVFVFASKSGAQPEKKYAIPFYNLFRESCIFNEYSNIQSNKNRHFKRFIKELNDFLRIEGMDKISFEKDPYILSKSKSEKLTEMQDFFYSELK